MKIGRIGVLAFALCVVAGVTEAALPKPVSMINRVTTGQSSGSFGLRWTKYNKSSWGNRWRQTLGTVPVVMQPSVRSY